MITLYDTTLRDGVLSTKENLSQNDKLCIISRLDALGIDYVETGFLPSDALDSAAIAQVLAPSLKHSKLAVFGRTTLKDLQSEQDAVLSALATSLAPVVTLAGSSCQKQAATVQEIDADENLRTIASSVSYLTQAGKEVFYDAEHYFDGYKDDPGYALATLIVAYQAGVRTLVLCDSLGSSMPHEIFEIVQTTIRTLNEGGYECKLGICAYNDCGCAVANSMEALRAGAVHVQGTINGYGERAGKTDLLCLLANMQLKMGLNIVSDEQLAQITSTAHFVAQIFNNSLDAQQPYVGATAFVRSSDALVKSEQEPGGAIGHVDPHSVGNFSQIVASELVSKAALTAKAAQLGIALSQDEQSMQVLLAAVKQREALGYSFELADASFALLLKAQLGQPAACFLLESLRVITEKREDGKVLSEATVKLLIGNERYIATGEGKGPISAMDAALRLAIGRVYPQVNELALSGFKVRILDESKGSAAATKVMLQTGNGQDSWGTVGVSENFVEASWDALVEAITYGLMYATHK